MIERMYRHGPAALVASGAGVAALAIATQGLWRVLPWERFALSLLLAVVASGAAWLVRRGTRCSPATALLVAWLLPLLLFAGPLTVLAAGLLALAALAVGLTLAPQGPGAVALAIATGLMLVAGLTGWTVTWPLHAGLAWLLLLAAVVALRHVAVADALRAMAAGWREAVAAAPRWAAFATMLFGLASTACWLPTLQADDLAYHLGLPSQWLADGRYAPDASVQVWAYAAWAGDVLQAIVAVLGGEHGRGALNALWLAVAAGSAWAACARLPTSPRERWACVALLASFPPLAWLAAGMQTELPATAVTLALAATLLPGAQPAGGRTYGAAILFGGLAALKSTHIVAALPLLAYAAWLRRDQAWPWRDLAGAVVVFLAVGGSSYWQAWQHTGNPVLPLFNSVFASPFFPVADFDDLRWHAGIDALLPWRLVVDTSRYGEGWDGGLGFSLLALGGAWLLALARRGHRGLAIAAALVATLPLLPMQYARYAVPGLALLLVVALPRTEATLGRRGFRWMIGGLCVLNLAFQANSGWTHHSALLKDRLRVPFDTVEVMARHVPERALLARLPAADRAVVLATNPARPLAAELGRRGRSISWMAPALRAAALSADADASGRRWRALFASTEAHWILMTPATASPALRHALADSRATRHAAVDDAELWRLPAGAHP